MYYFKIYFKQSDGKLSLKPFVNSEISFLKKMARVGFFLGKKEKEAENRKKWIPPPSRTLHFLMHCKTQNIVNNCVY